jgi:hypothetical protein
MKKLITSVFLIFGLYSNGSSQIDTCKVDYYNMFNMDSVLIENPYYGGEIYGYYYNRIFNRYSKVINYLYNTDRLLISREGDSFIISNFTLYVESKNEYISVSQCQLEDMLFTYTPFIK